MKTTNNELGRILREARLERKMSLRDFSEHLGISHAYLNKLEIGKDPRTGKEITPTIETLAKLAEGLQMSIKDFLNLCGYLKSEGETTDAQDVELTSFTNDFITALLATDNLMHQGRQVDQTQIQTLIEAIQKNLPQSPNQ